MEGMETLFVVMESGVMKRNEETKTAEVLGRKGRKNYEQDMVCVSRGSERDVGADR